MEVGYLGPLEVRVAGRVVPIPGQRLRTLLQQLALEPGAWVPAGTLTEAVWGDDPPTDPANSLQSLVSRLRRALGGPDLVEQSPAGYRLAVAPDEVDGVRFVRLAAEGRRLLEAGADTAAEDVLETAAQLWRGAPLADDDTPEAAARRAALDDLRLQVTHDRAVLAVRGGRGGDVVPALEELTAAHPLREDLALVLMDALVAAGRPAEALFAYERVRETLAETLGTDPSPALRARHLEVLRLGERAATPPTNLRAALTSFVGRDDDVRTVRERLGGSRLVTIVGAGGSGKTRLAGEVAAGMATRPGGSPGLPDGVWLVELAPVTDPDAVAQAILDGLGLREIALPDQHADRPRREPRARLLEILGPATCLLVVDNCEHLIDAVADLVDEVLGRCSGVRVLATSREPLGIDGETLHPLGPLPTPPAGIAPVDAAGNPAVRLLLDRARAVDPDVCLDEPVLEIVRRLDGLPLAIELAAARLRVLSTAEVADRLADRFRLLTGGRRTATPRHRTLRAVVEWSWELLSPLEREVAEHFSVFAGGATEAAVAAVCPSWRDGAGPAPVGDVLHALVDKSLLLATRTPAGTRCRMLETLREYGAERLDEQGTITAARAAHARWFAGLVRESDPHLRGPEQLAALHVLDTERDDVLAALRFLGDDGDAAGVVDLVVHLGWYWLVRENGQEAERWMRFALDVPGARDVPGAVLAEAMITLLAYGAGGGVDLAEHADEMVALSERLAGTQLDHPAAVILRPLLLFLADRRDGAGSVLDETLGARDPWVRAAGRLMRMAYAENEGDVDGQREDAEKGVPEWEAIGDRWGLASMLSARGQLRMLDGDLIGASEDQERAAALMRVLGSHDDHVMVEMRLADLRLRAGDAEGARRHLATMRETRSYGPGDLLKNVLVGVMEAAIAVTEDDGPAAERAHERLHELLDALGDPTIFSAHGASVGHAAAAGTALLAGLSDDAEAHVREAYRQALLTNDRPIVAAVGLSVAGWARAIGRPRDAAVVLGATARLRGADDPTNPVVIGLTRDLREDLGADFDACYAEGAGLDGEAAAARVDPDSVRAAAPVAT